MRCGSCVFTYSDFTLAPPSPRSKPILVAVDHANMLFDELTGVYDFGPNQLTVEEAALLRLFRNFITTEAPKHGAILIAESKSVDSTVSFRSSTPSSPHSNQGLTRSRSEAFKRLLHPRLVDAEDRQRRRGPAPTIKPLSPEEQALVFHNVRCKDFSLPEAINFLGESRRIRVIHQRRDV